ncbi:MAG TPA: hypothetical protein VGN63_05275 [Flavisolibacter sp.]|nr:hypothetical protein [Flavisolibacter sp.]
METKAKHTHRGALLQAVVAERHVNITKMVKRMGISRGTYYNHIADPELPFEQLVKYGKAIGYDFSQQLPGIRPVVLEEPEGIYKTPKTIEEAIEQRDYWRERYYRKVDEYNDLAKKHMRVLSGEKPEE